MAMFYSWMFFFCAMTDYGLNSVGCFINSFGILVNVLSFEKIHSRVWYVLV